MFNFCIFFSIRIISSSVTQKVIRIGRLRFGGGFCDFFKIAILLLSLGFGACPKNDGVKSTALTWGFPAKNMAACSGVFFASVITLAMLAFSILARIENLGTPPFTTNTKKEIRFAKIYKIKFYLFQEN